MLNENKLKKAQEGDLKSIEEICADTWESLYRFIYYKVQNREEAEDITQETYVRALSHLEKGKVKIETYIGFLKTVSLNVLRDRWRARKRRGESVSLEDFNMIGAASGDYAEESVRREMIRNALNKLSDERRTVIELRILKGYSTAEAAKIMGKKEGALRVLQYRALKELAGIFEKEGLTKGGAD